MNQQENKQAYVKKMDRQIRAWQEKIEEIESRAQNRKAEQNVVIRKELQTLHKKIEDARDELNKLKQHGEEWPEGSRRVSGAYKSMKATASDANSRVKRK